jgi:ubiquinone/menaquinone biosynthesis C-methylase UbiE
MTGRSFVPAAGHDLLLPLYDPLLRLMGADVARQQLIDQVAMEPGHRVLDVGCGTGSLVVQIKRNRPEAEVFGLDPDPKALARARRKTRVAGLAVQFDQGFADQLPYDDGFFDRIVSTFVLHHLDSSARTAAIAEWRRVLKAEGSLHILDFGGESPRKDGLFARLLHSTGSVQENFADGVPAILTAAGFATARQVAQRNSLVGTMAYYVASAIP